MADRQEFALMAHLMRRAGFGATHDELEHLVEQGYEATVEKLLSPETEPDIDEALPCPLPDDRVHTAASTRR